MAKVNCSLIADENVRLWCESDQSLVRDVNSFFVIWAATLVLFMHAGFAMLSAGALRTKNTKNILLSIVMDLTVCAIAWYMCGFAFAFGNDAGGFIGSSFWVGIDVGSESVGVKSFYFWLFQYCFAATGATIVSGAVAERARFETYLFYSFYMSFWVYPVVVHWVWGGGFLTLGNSGQKSLMGSGVVDFAGCGPVHMVGGLAGAIGSKIMGPRIGRFDPETREPFPMPGHSSPLSTLGVFILWVGWLGFNPGSVINLTSGGGSIAARAAVTTILSSSSGALSSMFGRHLTHPDRDFDLEKALNGALAGLVSITASCAFVEMWAAIIIGFFGGLIYLWSSHITLHVLRIDDPLDATPVHFFCGMWGIIAGSFFANPTLLQPFFKPEEGSYAEVPSGVFYGGNTYVTVFSNGTVVPGGQLKGALVANAVVEICCIIVWVTVFMTPMFWFFNKMGVLRVGADIEAIGLDISHHGGHAYNDIVQQWNYQDVKRSSNSGSHNNPINHSTIGENGSNGMRKRNTPVQSEIIAEVSKLSSANYGPSQTTPLSRPGDFVDVEKQEVTTTKSTVNASPMVTAAAKKEGNSPSPRIGPSGSKLSMIKIVLEPDSPLVGPIPVAFVQEESHGMGQMEEMQIPSSIETSPQQQDQPGDTSTAGDTEKQDQPGDASTAGDTASLSIS